MPGQQERPRRSKRFGSSSPGACTTEIAAFDQFAGAASVVAATPRPTNTSSSTRRPPATRCRLLQPPAGVDAPSWTRNDPYGASCLGPHSGLTMHRDRFAAALARSVRSPPARPSYSSLAPMLRPCAKRTEPRRELRALGIQNQQLDDQRRVPRARTRQDGVALRLRAQRDAGALATNAGGAPRPSLDVRGATQGPTTSWDSTALRGLLSDDKRQRSSRRSARHGRAAHRTCRRLSGAHRRTGRVSVTRSSW